MTNEQLCVGAALRETARHHGDIVAFIEGERSLSFAELDHQADVLAKALLAQGVKKGDHIGVWLPTCAEWIVLFCAISRIGAVIVPVNTRYKAEEIGYLLRLCDVKLLFTQPEMWSIGTHSVLSIIDPAFRDQQPLEFELSELPMLEGLILIGEDVPLPAVSLEHFVQTLSPARRLAEAEKAVSLSDRLLVCSTSGSTGKPKGVVHAHRALKHCLRVADATACRPGERMLAHWPLHHAGGCFSMLVPAIVGATTMVAVPHWEGDIALDLIERHGVTTMGGVATHYFDLVEAQSARPRNLASLSHCWIGGSPLSKEAYDRIVNGLGIGRLPSTYGMTENSTSFTFNRPEDPDHICRDNRAPVLADAEVKVVDPDSLETLGADEVGEIWCRGEVVMDGYYGDPEMTAQAITADGWLRTGDLGLMDASGYIKPTGRLKEMYKVGGSNVSPTEVELCLNEHDDILAAVAVGVPHERLVEVGFVYVQARPGSRLEDKDIIGFCKARLADYKVPRYVRFVDDFPRLPIGKIDRKKLAQMACS